MLAKEVPDMSGVKNVEPFGEGFIAAMCPELIIFAGLIPVSYTHLTLPTTNSV